MRRTTLLVPLLVLLPACGGGDEVSQRAATRDVTSQREAGSTPSPAATVAVPEPSPTPAAQRSAVATAPATQAPRRPGPAAQGDVDGDGEPDVITVGDRLSVVLSGSGASIGSAFRTDTEPVVSGSEDVDRDGHAEVFLRTARGATTTFLTPFRYDGSSFAPLTRDGQQLLLGIGGSATHGEGFSCTDTGALVVRTALRQDDGTWDVSSTTYEIRGHSLVQVDGSDDHAIAEDDPRVGAAYLVDCRSVGEDG